MTQVKFDGNDRANSLVIQQVQEGRSTAAGDDAADPGAIRTWWGTRKGSLIQLIYILRNFRTLQCRYCTM